MERTRVILGLSGGVDSAVAALLLQREGYEVQAVFMKNWSEDDFGGPCPWAEDQASAQAVADHLHIPLTTWNFEREYRQRVFSEMIAEYNAGRTPNPDILCNREIKFDLFLQRAKTLAPLIATGHYAQTRQGRLFRAADANKDQSYFLSGISSAALGVTLFPIGHLTKDDVRSLARAERLPNWDRPDSVGICFVGEKKMREFLQPYVEPTPGAIQLPDGTEIGRHDGLAFLTIGQRHGFGKFLDQKKVAGLIGAGKPLVVVAKHQATQTVVVAPAADDVQATTSEFLVRDAHWIRDRCSFPWTGTAKLRYRQPDVPVTVMPEGDRYRVVCHQPQRAVTPGQYAVWYAGDECIGNAVIDEVNMANLSQK